MFHKMEEQQAFERAEKAFILYLVVRDKCAEDWANINTKDED